MSDLSGKFEALGTQLATQHEAMMDALNTIAYAIGTMNTNLSAIDTHLVSFHTETAEQLTDLFSTLDTFNNNSSLNAQRILTLMLQTACPCDATDPLLPLPVDTDPTELENNAKCQRIQYFLDLFGSWAITTAVYLDSHGSISSFQVKNLLDIALLDVGITDSELNHMSISTRDNLTILLNTSGSTSSINTAIFNAINDTDFMDAMRQALYDADNASAGKSAADDVISANVSSHANIIAAMFYASWLNVMYSTSPEVDASAYDGDICGPSSPFECTTIASQVITITGYGNRNAIAWPSPFTSTNVDEIGNHYSANQVLLGDYQYCILTVTAGPGARLLKFNSGSYEAYSLGATPYMIPNPTTSIWIDDFYTNSTFSVEICPPAS